MRGQPRCAAAPVANAKSVSLVEVSPSIVTQLKVLSALSATRGCRAAASMAASVKTKHSIVAMSGWIMPAPLQKPLMTTSAAPILALRVASLGKVSVVRIARAAAQPSSRPDLMAGRPRRSFQSSGWPITPVGP
jgi:hypothetical protein